MLQKIVLVLVLLACAGCGKPLVIVPNDIGSRGVLVGEVCVLDGSRVPYADPVIDQKQYVGGMEQGYFTVPLSPGQHSLGYLLELVSSGPVVSKSRIYPIGVDFSIEAKQATTVGLLLIDPSKLAVPSGAVAVGSSSMPYRFIALDNSADMELLLRDARPQLFQSLRADQPMSASKPHPAPAALDDARQTIISKRFEQGLRQGRAPSEYVTGCAGTVGRMTTNANGQATFKALLTNTLANLSACNAVGDRLVCLTSRDKYISVNGDQVTHQQLPAGMQANSLHAVSKDRLVLIDDWMHVYSSTDNGATWSKYTGAAFDKPLGSLFITDPKHRFGVHVGASNFYIFGRGMGADQTRVLRGDHRTGEIRNLEMPKADYLTTVQETQAGLFVAPSMTHLTKGKLQFLPKGSDVWQQRETPSSGCTDLAFPDDSGINLQLMCWDDTVWSTTDGGLTWKRMFRANSLFAAP